MVQCILLYAATGLLQSTVMIRVLINDIDREISSFEINRLLNFSVFNLRHGV